jgi:hypothetical protein
MDELNRRLTQPPEFDLADSDQLGLLVVSRLADRHGIKVTLRSSPYGGVTAIVLIPKELVVPAGMAVPREVTAHPDAVPWPDLGRVPAAIGPRPAAFGPPSAAFGPPPGSAAPAAPRATAGPPAARPDGQQDQPPDADVTDSHQGLPRRTRQASLAPQLRDAPPAHQGVQVAAQPSRGRPGSGQPGGDQAGGDATGDRSAEQARSLISSVQQGWRSGRAAAEQAGDKPGDQQPPPREDQP